MRYKAVDFCIVDFACKIKLQRSSEFTLALELLANLAKPLEVTKLDLTKCVKRKTCILWVVCVDWI